jgi:hypothetical protein
MKDSNNSLESARLGDNLVFDRPTADNSRAKSFVTNENKPSYEANFVEMTGRHASGPGRAADSRLSQIEAGTF